MIFCKDLQWEVFSIIHFIEFLKLRIACQDHYLYSRYWQDTISLRWTYSLHDLYDIKRYMAYHVMSNMTYIKSLNVIFDINDVNIFSSLFKTVFSASCLKSFQGGGGSWGKSVWERFVHAGF